MYGEDRWKIGPWYLESLALALGPKSLALALALRPKSLLTSLPTTGRNMSISFALFCSRLEKERAYGDHFLQNTFMTNFIMRPSYRPRIAHLSVRLSVRPSVCPVRARNSKTKIPRKIRIDTDVLHGTSKWSANFQFERSKVKVTGRRTSKIWRHVYLRAAAPADQARQTPNRPPPLLGLLYCRRLRPLQRDWRQHTVSVLTSLFISFTY